MGWLERVWATLQSPAPWWMSVLLFLLWQWSAADSKAFKASLAILTDRHERLVDSTEQKVRVLEEVLGDVRVSSEGHSHTLAMNEREVIRLRDEIAVLKLKLIQAGIRI
ncbi:hypothetical protein GCM10007874_17720 [Labrys miyagiensis]|uniref:Uncharacterized protein n=1 Tax=Labrys miyagiensis TaxID=346912 RepID=A0ABQ6CF10_9HYPH|nr:hypothetical protein [Labrys miyagiensis]GLS18755.1 hypothetical protein GCM10007874_17720 [Labrys miyagiensis]